MTRRRILVINPNSSASVTAAIDEAVAPLRIAGGPDIEVVGLAEGPPGISSQRDAASVVMPLVIVSRAMMPMRSCSPASAIQACMRCARRQAAVRCLVSPNAASFAR